MSTIDTFRKMSGISQTSYLLVTPSRAQEIIDTVSTDHSTSAATSVPITLLLVSTYVNESKSVDSGFAYVHPKQPPFASHWGIVVDDLAGGEAVLLHLVLQGDGKDRKVRFEMRNVDETSKYIKGATVQPVGETKYQLKELLRIGNAMIRAFGNYHLIFWNCQLFAKCYLQVITGNNAVFTQWTSADVTNLFLCTLVVPMPIASTSKQRERNKAKDISDVGRLTAELSKFRGNAEEREVTEEEVFRASDTVIDLMKASWVDDETLKRVSQPIKDSSDKVGLIGTIKGLIQNALGRSG